MTASLTKTTEIVNEAVPVEWKETPLEISDRCDRCGAQAFVRTFHRIGNGEVGELTWCAHHFNKNEPIHRESALHIQDERDKLNVLPSPSGAPD